MTIRLLAPAGPVFSGRLATVSARLRLSDAGGLATWRWDDGGQDQAPIESGSFVRASRTHRYDAPGVYRVRVQVGDGGDHGEERFVTVARPDQIAASGWVRDVDRRERIAFGFLITLGGDGGAADAAQVRALVAGSELASNHVEWLLAPQPGSLHFGGLASYAGSDAHHPYRIDVLRADADGGRSMQRMTMSVYASGAVPGHDSPAHRVSGVIRPGHVALGPFGA